MTRIQNLVFTILICASLTTPYSLKALTFSACDAENCKTMGGLRRCLTTNPEYAQWEGGPFFKKNADGTYMQRITQVVVAISNHRVDGSKDTFQKPITIPVIVNVISPAAFKAFQEVAQKNTNCMRMFCKENCLLLQKIDRNAIAKQIQYFDSQSTITIGGVVYRSPEIPANPETGTERIRGIDIWANQSPEEKNILTENYLIDQANNITSIRCLSEGNDGVKLRMFCSQCAMDLDKGNLALLSKTCASFDPARNVGYGMELQELSEEYQAELARAKLDQERFIQMKALAANNPDIKNVNQGVNFSELAAQFSAGLPGFSDNPYKIPGGIEGFQ